MLVNFTWASGLLFIVLIMLFLGWGHRVLDRMRLSDTQAIILLGLMLIGSFIPSIQISPGVSVDLGGALIPLGIGIYLIVSANTSLEKVRAIIASLVTAAIIFATDRLLPSEPGVLFFDIDPVWLPAIVGGVVGYLAGRSRRAAFIAGVFGVILADGIAMVQNMMAGIPGALLDIGGGGVFDATVYAGFLAVLLAEVVGESREYLQGGPKREGRSQDMLRQLEHEHMPVDPLTKAEKGKTASENTEQQTVPVSSSILAVFLSAALVGAGVWFGGGSDEVLEGTLYRIVDERGIELLQTQRIITPGDGYIDEGNQVYRVKSVEQRLAIAERVMVDEQLADADRDEEAVAALSLYELFGGKNTSKDRKKTIREENVEQPANEANEENTRKVRFGLYTTHNGESYVTNAGESNVNGKGDIHIVAATLAESLKKKGYEVEHSEKLHLPHDRGAYRRSRRTAIGLLNNGADMLVDVHRDAGSWTMYAKEVQGEWMTQVKLVVGRQNPNQAANLRVAKELKAIADEQYPGLVKGILIGNGMYNQDLAARTILIELGTEQNSLESAKKGAKLFADVLSIYAKRNLE